MIDIVGLTALTSHNHRYATVLSDYTPGGERILSWAQGCQGATGVPFHGAAAATLTLMLRWLHRMPGRECNGFPSDVQGRVAIAGLVSGGIRRLLVRTLHG